MSDPDTLVDWEQIEQVNLKTSSVPSCPICLHPPTAAKVTRCGHVFCWACILHYLALSDNSTRKCPICNDEINKNDLKSVVSLLHSEINIGDEIEMHLMRRERNSLFAVPVGEYHAGLEKKHPCLSDRYNAHSQLITATPSEVAGKILTREREDLEKQMREEGSQPEACFIQEAMTHLSSREMSVMERQEVTGLGNLAQVNDESNASGASIEPAVSAPVTPEHVPVGTPAASAVE